MYRNIFYVLVALLLTSPTFPFSLRSLLSCDRFGIETPSDCTCQQVHHKGAHVKCRDIARVPHKLDWTDVANKAGNNQVFAVDLSYNQLSHTVAVINEDVKLINLGHNLITNIRAHDFKDAPNLHFLDISFNNITSETIEETLTDLSLITLVASSNAIRSVSNLDLPKTLQFLHLDNNPVEEFQVSL